MDETTMKHAAEIVRRSLGLRYRVRPAAFQAAVKRGRTRQAALAQALGISGATLSRWATGKAPLRGDQAIRLASLLGGNFRALFEDER